MKRFVHPLAAIRLRLLPSVETEFSKRSLPRVLPLLNSQVPVQERKHAGKRPFRKFCFHTRQDPQSYLSWMSRKRNVSELKVSGELYDEICVALRCTDYVSLLLQPDGSKWRMAKYADIVHTFQHVQERILWMDEPSVQNFESWFEKLVDLGKEKAVNHVVESIKSLERGNSEFKGWDDLYAAYCMMNVAFSVPQYKSVVDDALKVERDFHDNEGRAVIIGLKNTLKQVGDKYQQRAVKKFFDAIKARDPKLAIRMKRCLEYPPRVEPKILTKEEKQHLEALEIVRDEIDDEEF